jgi:hypothetical protein
MSIVDRAGLPTLVGIVKRMPLVTALTQLRLCKGSSFKVIEGEQDLVIMVYL